MSIPGIDVSNNNGVIDWPRVAAGGIVFAFIKASEGVIWPDAYFLHNWAAAKVNGLARLAYHFARPELNTADAEAAYFGDLVAPVLEAGDGVALDVETGDGDLSGWVTRWLDLVTERLGFRPLLYSGPWFMTAHGLTGNAALAQSGLWLASWGVATPTVPAPWSFWAAWQYSAGGAVPGISGPVDLDAFNGTLDQLRAYGKPPPPADPCADVRAQLAQAEASLTAATGKLAAGLSAAQQLVAALS